MKTKQTHTLRPGTILEKRYRIERVIGEGGFGITYEAVNEKIELTVAIKEFYCRDYTRRNVEESNQIEITATTEESFEKAKRRFLQEAKILSGFNNETAIVKILDYFEENGTAYIVMNYLFGTPLDQYIKKHGTMPWREVLQKFEPLIETLERIHNRGVIHRDISPSNIMVLENGDLCLLDFGSAKDRFIEEGKNVTTIFSKQGYTPIEQYAREGQLGAWTDVYALSAVIYECLTGTHPPDSVQRAIYDEYETMRDKKIEAPPELDTLLKKGLAVRAEGRYSNMGELREAVNALLVETKNKKRKWICLIAAAVVVLCTVAGAWFVRKYQEQIHFRFKETEAFRLVRDEDTTIADFDRDFARIEERIKILTGTEPYIWRKENDEFYGVLPLSCFGGEEPGKIILDLIARPCKWTICAVELDDKYIDRIEVKDEEKCKLEITLSDNVPVEKQNTLKELCKDQAVLSVDFGYDNHLSLNGQMVTPLSYTWDLQEEWEDKKMRELFVHNISQDALSGSMNIYTQIQTVWETGDSGADFGTNQCDPADLSSDTVTLEYGKSYEDKRTEGEIADFVLGIKERLDVLEIPYAVGREKNDIRHVVICVNQEDYNEDLFWLLFRVEGDVAIEDGWGTSLTSYITFPEIEPGDSSQGKCLMMNIPEESEDEIEDTRKCVEQMEHRGIETYYLVVGGIRLLKGSRSDDMSHTDEMKRGKFTFSSLCLMNEEPGGENEKMIKLLNVIIRNKYEVSEGRELLAYQFSDREHIVAGRPKEKNSKYRFSDKEEKQMVEKIKAISDQYEVKTVTNHSSGNKTLMVFLSKEIYSEARLDHEILIGQICRIMEECNIEKDSPWNEINIGIYSRYKKDSYAVRLNFDRSSYLKKGEKAYRISIIAYETEEGKWIKQIYKKMKEDRRFQGYCIEYSDYTNYHVY